MKLKTLLFYPDRWRVLTPTAFLVLFTFITFQVSAQQVITGKVSDENNVGMPGVNVLVKGTSAGTTSDSDGNYSLTVSDPNQVTLVFSFIGYTSQEVPIGGRTTVDITMQPSLATLSEVVVVGYGTQKKSDITGAVASLSQSALTEVSNANVVQALQGRIAGVDIARTGSRPGAGGQIRIRGNRSLSGSNDPLIVLDGIPYQGSINDINSDDIASVDVLKDASATAIYGSRGSNGVIILTTKRGKSGTPQIYYNGYVGISKALGKYDLFNAKEFKAFRDYSGYTAGYSPMELEGIANGTDSDWQDVAFRNGHVSNHELGISGGSNDVTYGFSAGYFKEQGILDPQSFERFSLRSTIDAKIGSRIRVGLNSLNTLNYTNGEGVNPMYAIARITPLAPVYNANGTPNLYPQAGTVDETATMNPLTLWNDTDIVDRRRRLRTFNSLYGEVSIVDGLKYRLNVGVDFRQDNRGTYTGPNTIMNAAAGTTKQASATVANGEAWTYVLENLLTYEKTFADVHRLSFTGLFSVQKDRNFNTQMNGSNFPFGEVQYYNFSLADRNSITLPGNNNNFTTSGLMSYMGRVNYAFNDKYLLTATFRRDGSSVFPKNQFLNYPAFALGWNVSKEDFMSGIKPINNLKVRLGYGVTGNQGIPANATRGSLAQNRYNYSTTNVFGYFVSTLPNIDLRWEDTKQYNLGIDFGLFNNRISGSIELYRQTTDNLLVQKSLPRSNGANSYWTNAASTRSKGMEINLSTVNIETPSGFSWTSDFNISLNREEITRLADPTIKNDIGNGWFVGQPINVIYDFTKEGIWQIEDAVEAATYSRKPGEIRIKDISGPDGTPDGKITDLDRSVIGTFQPKWIGGMTHRFAFKNFELSTVWFARMGGTLVATYLATNGGGDQGYFGFNSARPNQYKVDYWTPNNPTNAFPAPTGGVTNLPYSSTLSYYDASFVKVRNITLGYNLPSELLERIRVTSFKVYVSIQNPFIVYSPFVRDGLGFDPEGTGTGGAVQTQGGETNQGVSARAITVGLNTPSVRWYTLGVNIKL
ncbi:SusC/RagA family TonB-linked outer membrane protein [Pseudochryseolinea flava]|uniref:SusC/RagA family TonB-linked outer membrane protein n=1 Tax=Pseudochryseolinea flava TaxID=2059302 RepID=A0A364XX65_9BACT|nr:TonB-dependent receptor [Pseudochryseolinea flava]RAV99034.1 SusC/RagA family TonB-linked outer membrane protein [Pseudochryseolinea flava]